MDPLTDGFGTPPKPCRNHPTETAETINETAPKPRAKPKAKQRNSSLKGGARWFRRPRARGPTAPHRDLALGFATLRLRFAGRSRSTAAAAGKKADRREGAEIAICPHASRNAVVQVGGGRR
jgi:hypothetical protein